MLTISLLHQIANDLLHSSSCTSRENSFEERFKYDIISSSLLSSSLAAPTSATRRSFTPEIPGKLDDGGGGSADDEHFPAVGQADGRFPDSTSNPNLSGQEVPIALLSIAVVFLSAGFYFMAIIFLAAGIYSKHVMQVDQNTQNSTSQVSCATALVLCRLSFPIDTSCIERAHFHWKCLGLRCQRGDYAH